MYILVAVYKIKQNQKKPPNDVPHTRVRTDSGAVLLDSIAFDSRSSPSNGAYTEVVPVATQPQQQVS